LFVNASAVPTRADRCPALRPVRLHVVAASRALTNKRFVG